MSTQVVSRPIPLPERRDASSQIVTGDRRVYYFVKRVFDFAAAAVLLILLLPLMIVIGAAIYIYSPGPIFFVQERVGARRHTRGKTTIWEVVNFPCFKFRTMKPNADAGVHKQYVQALINNDEQGMQAAQERARGLKAAVNEQPTTPAQGPRKLVADTRIIRPGHIIRKLSLDELPQLFNVLRGEMSLIGPRPAIPYEVEVYKPWHKLRLQAQPGLSGLQQVKARCTEDFDEQVKLDIEYIEHQSLWLDLKIVIETPLAIIFGKGAY